MNKTSQDSKNLFILAFSSTISFENKKTLIFQWFYVVIGYYCDRHTFYNHQNFIANANWAYFNRLIWTHLFQKFTLEIDRQVMRTLIPICEHFKLNVLHQLHQNWGCQLIKFDTYLIWTRYKTQIFAFLISEGLKFFGILFDDEIRNFRLSTTPYNYNL